MPALRREDVSMYLAGAAAVCAPVSIAACQILMGLAIAWMIVTRARWRVPRIWLPLAVFFVGTIISLIANGHLRQGLPNVKKFYVYAMLFLVTSAFSTVRQVRWIALGWAAAASLSAIWGLNQFYNKVMDAREAHIDFYSAYIADRITGFMSHWMTFSGHMMMALLVIGAIVFFSTDRRWIAWLIAAGAVIGTALVAAETRSMWLGTAVAGAYLIWNWRRWLLLAIPLLAGIVLLTNPIELGDRLRSTVRPHGEQDSNAHRAMCRAIGYQMIKAHPWIGIGPERVQYEYLNYLPPGTRLPLPAGFYGHLHNIYVHYAAELGIPTMLALMWMIGRALYDFLRGLRRPGLPPEAVWVLRAAVAVIVGILFSGYFEKNIGDSEVLEMFLAVLACGYVAVMEEPCKV